MTRKTPSDCATIGDVRDAIDDLDRAVVAMLAERYDYAKRGAELKAFSPPAAAPAGGPSRLETMIQARRSWAQASGVSADAVEAMFRALIAGFVVEEDKHVATQAGAR